MNRRHSSKAGFTLVELMIVIGIISTLMGLVVFIYPKIQNMLNKTETNNNLHLLQQALIKYKSKRTVLPRDTEYESGVVNNDHLFEALETYGVEEKMMKDAWGRPVFYDRLKDIDGGFEIGRDLPENPLVSEFPSDTLSEDQERRLDMWSFVIWSLGPEEDNIADNMELRGK